MHSLQGYFSPKCYEQSGTVNQCIQGNIKGKLVITTFTCESKVGGVSHLSQPYPQKLASLLILHSS